MTRMAVVIVKQQRWLRVWCRISSSPRGFPERKRTRTFTTAATATAAVLSNHRFAPCTNVPAADVAINFSRIVSFQRYHSSTSTSTPESARMTFPNPLHRNPSRISSSVGSIYKPPGYFLGIDNGPVILPSDDKIVIESVRSCIKIDEDNYNENGGSIDNWNNPHENDLHTEMSLCFLGTGAGIPTSIRSTSGTFLRLGGTTFMFDVGEGTQRQFQFAKGTSSTISKIDKIFISHLHGDHIFGLPGFLLSMQSPHLQAGSKLRETNKVKGRKHQNVKDEEDFTVRIYGPPGLFNYIASAITLSCTKLHLLNVHVYELVGGRVRRVVIPPPDAGRYLPRGSSRQQHDDTRDPFHSDYPEFRHNGGRLRRFEIPCQKGVWNIQYNPLPLSREDITRHICRDSPGGAKSMTQRQQERIRIRAAEVDHMPGVATFGFVIEEDEPPRNLDVDKAKALGVSHKDKKYELLRHGFAVTADDGSERRVEPHEVLKALAKKARKIAFIGDNRGWTSQISDIARNSDIMVHEATLTEEDPTKGHSTAAMAGRNAAKCDVKLLILNHISPRMESNLSKVVWDAYNASNKKLSVLMSFDFMEVVVPWLGFGAATTATTGCDRIIGTDVGFDTNNKKEVNRKNLEKWTKSVFSESKSDESKS